MSEAHAQHARLLAEDQLSLDDLEVLILLHNDLSEEVRQKYLHLIEKLRAHFTTERTLNGEI